MATFFLLSIAAIVFFIFLVVGFSQSLDKHNNYYADFYVALSSLRSQNAVALSQDFQKMTAHEKKQFLWKIQENTPDWQRFLNASTLRVLLANGYNLNHRSSFRATPSSEAQTETLMAFLIQRKDTALIELLLTHFQNNLEQLNAFIEQTKESRFTLEANLTEKLYVYRDKKLFSLITQPNQTTPLLFGAKDLPNKAKAVHKI